MGLQLEPHRAATQPYNDLPHMNSLTASHSHIEAYQRYSQPPCKVSIALGVSKVRNTLQSEYSPLLTLESPVVQWLDQEGSWV